MNSASVNVLVRLQEELSALMEQALALADAAEFHRVVDDAGELVAGLKPSEEQRLEAIRLDDRLKAWQGVVAGLIRRYAITAPVNLDHLVSTTSVYFRLERFTRPDVIASRWRLAFESELTRL